MSYLSAASQADIIANPETITSYYGQCRVSFVASLGTSFAGQCEDHLRLAFCSVVAFDLKPYGSSASRGLKALMADAALDCDNYVSLAWELFYLMRPLTPTKVTALGWNGGAVGNHAQMQAQTAGSPDILLDPTIGLVVHGFNFDALCKGIPFSSQFLKSFWAFSPKTNIQTFEQNVRNAITGGQYKASDLLYFVPNLRNWNDLSPVSSWATPQSWNI